MSSDATYAPHPKVVYRDLDPGSGGVLLRVDTGAYYGLNPPGTVLWKLIDGRRSSAQIASEAAAAFEHAPADIEAVVRAFIDDLAGRDLLESSS